MNHAYTYSAQIQKIEYDRRITVSIDLGFGIWPASNKNTSIKWNINYKF